METQTVDAPFIDTTTPGFNYADPAVARAAQQSWYARTPLGPLILRYAEAVELMHDRRVSIGADHYMQMHKITEGATYDWWVNNFSAAEPVKHARIRALVSRAFTPRQTEELRPAAREIAERLADDIAASPECEFVRDFTDPLPALVMSRLLGVPAADYQSFSRVAKDIGLSMSVDLAGLIDEVDAAVTWMTSYVTNLIAQRREHPGPDLISELIAVHDAGDGLSTPELENLLVVLVWGGLDTTSRQLGQLLVTFSEHPDQWELVMARPDLVPQAVEEACRIRPMVQAAPLFAEQDMEYRGLRIPAGTFMRIAFPVLNRDPAKFERPDVMDVTIARKVPPVIFGAGPHFCLGSNIASMELQEALRALSRRFGPPQIAGPITWAHPAAMIYGPDALPVHFPPASG